MDTRDFFSLVLPDEGLRCIAVDTGRGFKHTYYDTNEAAAEAALLADNSSNAVYFGCASYTTNKSRKADNVARVKAFWLDIDTQETKSADKAKYVDRQQAIRELTGFVDAVGLPRPFIMSSGGGIHAYWPLTESVSSDLWRTIAANFKKATLQYGLDADPSRTADVASVLRPVGTTHRKTSRQVKPVQVGAVIDVDTFRHAISAYLDADEGDAFNLGAPPVADYAALNSDLSGAIEYPPSDAEEIASKCGIIQMMRDTGGNTDQPTWYHSIGVLAFTKQGAEVCHAWSAGHPQYSPAETQAKVDQVLQFKPTTCAKLGEGHTDICAKCRFAGKVNSPIVLGFEVQEAVIMVESDTPDEPDIPVDFPKDYRSVVRNDGRGTLQVRTEKEDENGNRTMDWMTFSQTIFYPTKRLRTYDGYAMEIEMIVKPGEKRRFMVDCSTIAEGGKALSSVLGQHEIVGLPRMKPMIEAYLGRWMDDLRHTHKEINTYDHFGWYDKEFLIGDTLITPEGERTVLLNGNAAKLAKAYEPTGSLEEWKRIVNDGYNYPGQEAMQYLLLCGFASPLFAMFKQYGGVTVYGHSSASGKGKTTACGAGISAFGNWKQIMLAEGKTTVNALWAIIGTHSNLPCLYDELTNMPHQIVSDLVFSLSQGQKKERLTASGDLRDNNANWSMVVTATGNNLLSEKLAVHRANAEAELMRIFEFNIDSVSRLGKNEADALFPALLQNYGHAGRVFMRYVVENYDRVNQMLLKVQQVFNIESNLTQSERYWSALQASVLTALAICRKLELIQFDQTAMKQWIVGQIVSNRTQAGESATDATEQFGRMLSDLYEGILVTEGAGDLRKGALAAVVHDPRGSVVGRYIRAQVANERTVLLLSVGAIKEWCAKRNASAREIFDNAVAHGWVSPDLVKYSLGKGTIKYASVASQVRCWVIDPAKLAGAERVDGVAQKLRVMSSGNADEDATGTGD